MAYASSSDITARYSSAELLIVADRDASGAVDTGIVTQALDDASTLIDAYLADRYTLPFATVPAVLVQLCVEISMYKMAENAGSLTDEKRRRFEDAIKLLERIADGGATLGTSEPDIEPENRISYLTDVRLFTRDKTSGAF